MCSQVFSFKFSLQIRLSPLFLILFTAGANAQLPEAISIFPEDATCFEEIILKFDPDKACIPDGIVSFSGVDTIFMESSAVLLYEEEGIGADSSLPQLYLDHQDSLFSITFTPSVFYGTGTELIKGITCQFKDGGGGRGMDFAEEGCQDFYLPFNLDTVGAIFNVDMSHQIFLGNFDPFFDYVDVVGDFNNWGEPRGTDLKDPDGDSIYTVSIPDLFAGQTIKYLFRKNRNWETAESFDSNGYRTYTILKADNNLFHWYNDQDPRLTSLTVNVNMNYAEELGVFDPAAEPVILNMHFAHWTPDSFAYVLLSDPDSNGVYTAVIDSLINGTSFSYIIASIGGTTGISYPWYAIGPDNNILDFWWNWFNPELQPDLFFSEYLDGPENNNALEIRNPTDSTMDLADYGILFTKDGGNWMGPLKMNGSLGGGRGWLIVHPDFDFSLIDSALVVDTAWSGPTTFDGNEALALVKLYKGGNKWRIIDQIGQPGNDPGVGWDVAGIADATSLHRLERKAHIEHGNPDWIISAGTSAYDSEWKVYGPRVPADLGKPAGIFNYDNLWTKEVSGVSQKLKSFAVTDNGWEFIVGEAGTAIYKTAGNISWQALDLDIPENYNLDAVFFTDSLNGWICGDAGTILHTTNGIDWTSQGSRTGSRLKSIFFTDLENGWAVGSWCVLHTRDGGQTWESQQANPGADFNKVHFIDNQHGWIVSENSFIRYTSDGGKSWEQMTGIPEGSYRDLYFYNQNDGWIVGSDAIYHTRDGGKTWSGQLAPLHFYYGVHFSSPLDGWIIGDDQIFHTRDGGISWEPQPVLNESKLLHDVYFTSENKGWILGDDGLILQTEDGWVSQPSPTTSQLYAVTFTDDSTGWIVGDQHTLLKTTDAGISWDTLSLFPEKYPNDPFADIFFVDLQTGWFGGAQSGVIYNTRDGGRSWEQQDAKNNGVFSIHFYDSNRGWAVGGAGAVSRTTNGGKNWEKTNIGTKNFYEVYFPDSLHGWAVGEEGRIIHSDDGGVSWVNQSGYTNVRMNAVYFRDSLHGIAFSDRDLLRTENGGNSWEIDNRSGISGASSVFFSDTLKGWATTTKDDIGQVWHTRDGGMTWIPLSITLPRNMNGMFFHNDMIGWMVGENGAIFRTSSGGCLDPFVNLPGIARICEGEEILLSGGNNYSYFWSTDSITSAIKASSAGWYEVEVRNGCNRSASDRVYLDVIPLPDFQIIPDGADNFCRGGQVSLRAVPDNPGMESEYTFQWEDDIALTGDEYLADTSGYFSVRVKDQFGCTNTDSIYLFEQNPFNEEEICLVTVDLVNSKNLIIWNKTPDVGIIAYNVYREKDAISQYDLIGTVPYEQLSIFKDTNSQPEVRQYLYKITSLDSCGNESGFSQYHKPLFLQYMSSFGGVNLQWSDYVVEGNPLEFRSYEIIRGSDPVSLVKIAEIPASLDRYTDIDVDALNHKYYYRVAGVRESFCYPSGTIKAEYVYSRSISNMEDNGITSGLNEFRSGSSKVLHIYPNPFTDRTLIQFPNPNHSRYQLNISDINGKTLKTIENIFEESYELNSDGLKKGILFIELTGKENFRGKILYY